jgi:hypothetical protein
MEKRAGIIGGPRMKRALHAMLIVGLTILVGGATAHAKPRPGIGNDASNTPDEPGPSLGTFVTPYAVTLQWDVFADSSRNVLVRLLYNERESHFKADGQTITPESHDDRFDERKRSYGDR